MSGTRFLSSPRFSSPPSLSLANLCRDVRQPHTGTRRVTRRIPDKWRDVRQRAATRQEITLPRRGRDKWQIDATVIYADPRSLRFAKDARLRNCACRRAVCLSTPALPSPFPSAPLSPATLIVSENPPQAAATIALYPPLPRRPRGIHYTCMGLDLNFNESRFEHLFSGLIRAERLCRAIPGFS